MQMRSTPPRSASPRTEESANQCSSLSNQRECGAGPAVGRCWRWGAPCPRFRLALSKHGPLPAAAYSWGEAPEPPTARPLQPLGPIRRQAPGYAATSAQPQHCRTLVFRLWKWGESRDLDPVRFMPAPCFPSEIFFHPDPQLSSPSRGSPTPKFRLSVSPLGT